jgi:hypothetical protein
MQTATIGHNNPPAYIATFDEIDSLYEEAKNFADGEPIASEDMHDAITKLYDGLNEAGKRADELRKEEKRPHDEAAKAVQAKYKPALTKVESGKAALGDLLAAWRAAIQREKAEKARLAREEADRIAAAAQAAIRASAGNLAERERAEALFQESKAIDRDAKRADKAATTGTGLRTVWVATLEDIGAALDWAYGREPERFAGLVQGMADSAVRGGARRVPGFTVTETKVAR